MLSKFINKILMGVLLVVLIALALLGFLYKKSIEEVVELEGQVASVRFEYESVKDELATKDSDMVAVNAGMRKVAIEFMRKEQELQKLKKFKDKLISDPEGSEVTIQKEMDDYVKNIVNTTGGVSQ